MTLEPRDLRHDPQPGSDWRQLMAESITDPATLLRRLQLPAELLADAEAAARLFPLRVPRPYWQKIRPGDPQDPLLRQVLPLGAEQHAADGFRPDPVGDLDAMVAPGLLHKYQGRALLVTTGACAIHCRYCFRRHFPYGSETTGANAWTRALAHIRGDPSLNEVILSGGDPLSVSDARLGQLLGALAETPQVKRVRLHTRLPIVLPQRVDEGLLASLATAPPRLVIVVHANHERELDHQVAAAMQRLAGQGVLLLNQSVLLKGVNDHPETLARLSERLFDIGVLPYYLHLLDPVAGAAHFALPTEKAIAIHHRLTAQLPGYLVPRLVYERPGASSKQVLA